MTEVKAPNIPWVNKNREEGRQPKRARTVPMEDTTTEEEPEENTNTTTTVATIPKAPSTAKDPVPIAFDQVPWETVITDNSKAFYAEQFKCIKVPVVLPNGQPLSVGFRTTLLWNPTIPYEGSNQKPEVHSSAPKNSPQYIGSVRFNARAQILYKEQHKKWGKDDKVPRSDLRLVSIPKPGGPKEKEAKEEARRCREFKETFVAPAGTTFWDDKIAAKWPWGKGKEGSKKISTGKHGCKLMDEHGVFHSSIEDFFGKDKTNGGGWEVVLVWQPYIWASNTTFKYGPSFNHKFMRIISRSTSAQSYNTDNFTGGGGGGDSSSMESSSSSSSSSFG